MHAAPALPGQSSSDPTALGRAVETDRIYFEMEAELRQLDGAVVAWMPGLTTSAAAAVIHRVDPEVVEAGGARWIAHAEAAFAEAGANLARIYLDHRHPGADAQFRNAGYADRDELVFVHRLPDPPEGIVLRPVRTDSDWFEKRRFHADVDVTPDGHGNRAEDWVELERRKCAAGMEAYLAEMEGRIVGAIGAIWGNGIVRAKNIVVHPAFRRRMIGNAMMCHIAALGRARGVEEQCVMAVRGETGEMLYRAAGMNEAGFQVEWSKSLGGAAK